MVGGPTLVAAEKLGLSPSIRHTVRIQIDDSTTHVAQFPFYGGTSRASEEEVEKAVVFFRAFLLRRLGEIDRGEV